MEQPEAHVQWWVLKDTCLGS